MIISSYKHPVAMHSSRSLILFAIVSLTATIAGAQSSSGPRRPPERRREKASLLKDAFYEDNGFVVRIKTSYNNSSTTTCNAVVMDERLVLSDTTCIKYHGMANIDARFVHVLAGDVYNESIYEIEQIYLNKADLRDPGTELALLKLSKPIKMDFQCRNLSKPEKTLQLEPDANVRVIGFTKDQELKENRGKSSRRNTTGKYICTQPGDVHETPGSTLLKGAPLLHMVDCGQYELVGILSRTDTIYDTFPSHRKHQDCYVMVTPQLRWYEQVRSLASLGAKNSESSSTNSYAPIVVEVEPEQGEYNRASSNFNSTDTT